MYDTQQRIKEAQADWDDMSTNELVDMLTAAKVADLLDDMPIMPWEDEPFYMPEEEFEELFSKLEALTRPVWARYSREDLLGELLAQLEKNLGLY